MDEREFCDQMLLLAEPIAATSRAVESVVERVDAKRRHRAIGVVTAAIVLIVAGGLATQRLLDQESELQPTGSRAVTMEAFAFQDAGVYLRAETTFDDDREIVGYGEVRAGSMVQTHGQVWADVPGGDQDDGSPYPFTVPAGVRISIEGPVEPDCADPAPEEFVFVIRSLRDGQPIEDTLVATNPDAYKAALADWCAAHD